MAGQEATADDAELDALWDDAPPRRQTQQQVQPADDSSSSDDDSYFGQGSENSEGDAAVNTRGPDDGSQERGAQQGGAAAAPGTAGALPSALDAFTSVDKPPAFLDPEATRPLAVAVHTAVNRLGADGAPLPNPHSQNRMVNKRGQAVGEWNVSQMAPKLKEEQAQEKGVISGSAVRYRTDDRVGTVGAAQIAMLGGHVADDGEGEGSGPASRHPAPKGKPTKPMGVDEFLEKGVGGAQLPRKRQDRKDKEKEKRVRGQSTHASWKSEAEMALRQQYD